MVLCPSHHQSTLTLNPSVFIEHMPSRKKALGQARKAKQAAAAATAAHGGVNSTNANLFQCNHLGEHIHIFSRHDWSAEDARNFVFDDFTSKANVDGKTYKEIMKLANEFYDNNYKHCSDVRKDLVRQIIPALGTECCFSEDEWKRATLVNYFILMHVIEARDKYNGTWDHNMHLELMRSLSDLSPRVAVRFFHRRNSCDCL
eukprot:scaffold36833_cov22-Cyclotella_meneghiniana.AAC.3